MALVDSSTSACGESRDVGEGQSREWSYSTRGYVATYMRSTLYTLPRDLWHRCLVSSSLPRWPGLPSPTFYFQVDPYYYF